MEENGCLLNSGEMQNYFMNFGFFIISVLLLISVIVMIFVVTYAKKENRIKYILIMVGVTMIFATTGFLGHVRYRPYLNQANYISPLIRDREPTMTTYVAYGATEEDYYSQFNDLDGLRNLVLYEEEQVTEPVVYLRHGDYFHYFERSDEQLFKQNRHIEFVETAQETQLIGSRFFLNDESFQEIGFKNPENTMFDYIKIPVSEQGKIYEPEDSSQIPRVEEEVHEWNF